MGQHSSVGVLNSDLENVMYSLDKYFSKKGLYLVEEKIAGRTSKFTTAKKDHYSLEKYREEEIVPLTKNKYEFTTNFSLFDKGDLTIIDYPVGLAQHTLNLDEGLSLHLSRDLNTFVFEDYYYSVVSQRIIRSTENGKIKDYLLITSDGKVDVAIGFFDQKNLIADENDCETDEYHEKVHYAYSEFFNKYGWLEISHIDYFDINQHHPCYLKGKPEKILEYLRSIENSLYW